MVKSIQFKPYGMMVLRQCIHRFSSMSRSNFASRVLVGARMELATFSLSPSWSCGCCIGHLLNYMKVLVIRKIHVKM